MPHKTRISDATRRQLAEKYGVGPGEWAYVECFYCGAPGTVNRTMGAWTIIGRLEIDHLLPEHLGGTSAVDNLVLACRTCNRSKGHKTAMEWLAA